MPSHRSLFSLASSALAAGVLLLSSQAALAGANDYVFESYPDAGKFTAQYAFGHQRDRGGDTEQAHSLALGYAPSDRWFTAVYAGWYREPGASFGLDELSWVNHVNLFKPGSQPIDVGFYLEIAREHDRSHGYAFVWGPTFQFDTAHVQFNANVWLEKNVRAQAADPTGLIYQWQAKRLVMPRVELGVQGFGSVGAWRHWADSNEQAHAIGPAVFLKLPAGSDRSVDVDAALLAGVTSASPRYTFRLRTRFQF